MPLRLIILTAWFMLFILAMHFFFFKSLIYFFNLNKPFQKIAVYSTMAVFTIIVISGFFAARRLEFWWVTGYYWFAAVWIGFLVHLLTAVVLSFAAILVIHLTKLPIEKSGIAVIFLLSACAYSIYGVFNAMSPQVRDVPVLLKAVPPAWENTKIVHLSDIHLGRVHGRRYTENLVSMVNDTEPDLVVITGDIFDGMGNNHAELVQILDGIKAGKGVFYISGNHEEYIGRQRAMEMLENTKMTRLANELVEIDGLEIIGVSYPGIASLEEIKGLPGDYSKNGNVRILLFHTPTSIMSQGGDRLNRHFTTYWVPDTSFYNNKKINVDLQLSGHTHRGQIFPINFLTRYLYKGFDYGLNRSGDLLIYTTSGAGTWGPPMRTASNSEIAVIRLRQQQ